MDFPSAANRTRPPAAKGLPSFFQLVVVTSPASARQLRLALLLAASRTPVGPLMFTPVMGSGRGERSAGTSLPIRPRARDLTYQGEADGGGGGGAPGLAVAGAAAVLSGRGAQAEVLDGLLGQDGARGLHQLLVAVPLEGGGRAGDGRARQVEVRAQFNEGGRSGRSQGDQVWSVWRRGQVRQAWSVCVCVCVCVGGGAQATLTNIKPSSSFRGRGLAGASG